MAAAMSKSQWAIRSLHGPATHHAPSLDSARPARKTQDRVPKFRQPSSAQVAVFQPLPGRASHGSRALGFVTPVRCVIRRREGLHVTTLPIGNSVIRAFHRFIRARKAVALTSIRISSQLSSVRWGGGAVLLGHLHLIPDYDPYT